MEDKIVGTFPQSVDHSWV